MRTFIFMITLVIRYTFAAGDVSHFIHYCLLDVDNYSFVTLLLLTILIDLLAYFHGSIPNISLKFKIRLQLVMHITFGINSLYLMISEKMFGIYGIIVFVFVFVLTIYVTHKIIHAMHHDDSGGAVQNNKANNDTTD